MLEINLTYFYLYKTTSGTTCHIFNFEHFKYFGKNKILHIISYRIVFESLNIWYWFMFN